MELHQRYLSPRVVHLTRGLKPIMKQPEKIMPLTAVRVLEIGIGSGSNLPFYAPGRIKYLWALDPHREILRLAESKIETVDFNVEIIEAPAEDIPLDKASADTVLLTHTLCTIPDIRLALKRFDACSNPRPG